MPVDFVIDRWYLLPSVNKLNNIGWDYGLFKGTSAETSGGLLIAMDAEVADLFIEEIYTMDGWPAFAVGQVIGEGSRSAVLKATPDDIIDVAQSYI